jgi:hypothetical protein
MVICLDGMVLCLGCLVLAGRPALPLCRIVLLPVPGQCPVRQAFPGV